MSEGPRPSRGPPPPPSPARPARAQQLAAYRRGESDLVWRGGTFYLYATCDVPQAPEYIPDGFTGVDLGIANIATTS